MKTLVSLMAAVTCAATAAAQPYGPSPGELPLNVTIEHLKDDRGLTHELILRDGENTRRYGRATLRRGRLYFSIWLRDEDSRSQNLYGRDVIRVALHEFGDRVRTVCTSWSDGDNLTEYLAHRAERKSPRAAAADTWTGRTLARMGFTRVGRPSRHRLYRDKYSWRCDFRRPRVKQIGTAWRALIDRVRDCSSWLGAADEPSKSP